MKILTIVGARPQFVKAAMVSRAIAERRAADEGPTIEETILHTGQHYDASMSEIFFDELEIPRPAVNLGVGSGPHGRTTAAMLKGIEREILARRPDWLLIYGDTNSALAGALAAVKLHVPVAHVEAGLRSFNRAMPEEINRVVADHVSSLLLCPTGAAVTNLRNEGITDGVRLTGDVMYDAALVFGRRSREHSTILNQLGLQPKAYYLATVHRAENTDDPERLRNILTALETIAVPSCPIIFPAHPRTRAALTRAGLELRDGTNVRLLDPVGFLDMVQLEQDARIILTDSGGVQKEAYFHSVPCVTLRDETEWVETVEHGWNQLAGADASRIVAAVAAVDAAGAGRPIPDYGDGHAAEAVVSALLADCRTSATGAAKGPTSCLSFAPQKARGKEGASS